MMLALATEKITKLLEHFCEITGLKQFAVAAIVISLATSLPELVVSIISAARNAPEMALGNAVGSNVVNLALVAGITAIWSRVIVFNHDISERRIIGPIGASFVPFALLLDGRISRGDGIVLLALYGMYVFGQLKNSQAKTNSKIMWGDKRLLKIIMGLSGWVMVLLISAGLAVDWAKDLAELIGLPLILVGLFVVAVGTSLPELVFNLAEVKHNHKSVAIGNIVGSNITNATLIVGLAALIQPFEMGSKLIWTTGVQYFFVVLAFLVFTLTKKKLERWEGVVLVGLFVYYTIIELMIR